MSKYKQVPVEPTDEMGIAGCEAVTEMPNNTWLDHYEAVACFKSMLAAAPEAKKQPVAWATLLYNTAYHAGHHDTVEGCYTHVYPQDMGSYHEDVVQEWLADNPQPTEQQPAPAVQGEPVGYVRPHQLEALRSGKACGITLEDKPDAHNRVTIPLYAAPQPAEQKSTACVGCEGAPVSGNSPCAVCGQKSALDVSALVDALEGFPGFLCGTVVGDKWIEQCRAALTAYRNQGVEP